MGWLSPFLCYPLTIRPQTRKNWTISTNRFNSNKRPWEPIQGQKVLRTGKLMFICHHICDVWQHSSENSHWCLNNLFNQALSVLHWDAFIALFKLFLHLVFFFVVHTAFTVHSGQRPSINIARPVKEDSCFSQMKKIWASFPTCDLRSCIIHISSGYSSLFNSSLTP